MAFEIIEEANKIANEKRIVLTPSGVEVNGVTIAECGDLVGGLIMNLINKSKKDLPHIPLELIAHQTAQVFIAAAVAAELACCEDEEGDENADS